MPPKMAMPMVPVETSVLSPVHPVVVGLTASDDGQSEAIV